MIHSEKRRPGGCSPRILQDSGFGRNDGKKVFSTSYETIKNVFWKFNASLSYLAEPHPLQQSRIFDNAPAEVECLAAGPSGRHIEACKKGVRLAKFKI